MEGLTIRKKVTPQGRPIATSPTDIATGFLIFAVLLVAIPFLLIGILIGIINDKFAPLKQAKFIAPRPIITHEVPNNLFPLRYHYIMGDEISEGAYDYFGDDEPLIIYQPSINNDFFKGYFSDFKIECSQGIFVQKVNFNFTLTEVESMPLYFFNYATKESEEILDLKGYNLYTKKQPNYFTITATSQDDAEEFATTQFELEISLTGALYSSPDTFHKESTR